MQVEARNQAGSAPAPEARLPPDRRDTLRQAPLPFARIGITVAVAVAALGLGGYPFGRLLADALTSDAQVWRTVLVSASTQLALANTAKAAGAAAVIATVLGAAFALFTEQRAVPGRDALRAALLLPILVPPFISAFGWVQAYGPAGWLQTTIGFALPGLFGAVGVTALLAAHGLPLAYLSCVAALRARGASELERAARVSGASAWAATRTVTLPLLRPAFVAGAGLVFLSAASDFGIPIFVGSPGRFPVVTTEIYKRLTSASSRGSFAAATILAALLAAVALVLLLLIARFGGGTAIEPGRGAGVSDRRVSGWADVAGGAACWLYVGFVSVLPFMALVLVALTRVYGLPQTPNNWTLGNFATLFSPRFAPSLLHSVLFAFATATLTLMLGGFTAAMNGRGVLGRGLSAFIALPYAVPGSTVAVATILAFNRWFYGSFILILLAYLGRFWALAERPITGALAQIGQESVRATRVSGASATRAVRDAILPAIRPALAVSWALVFLSAFHELTISSLLYGTKTQTIATVVLDTQQAGQTPVTAALAVLLTLIVLACAAPLLLSRRLTRLAGLGGSRG